MSRGLLAADAENVTLGFFGCACLSGKFGLGGGRFVGVDLVGVRLVAVRLGVCSGFFGGSPVVWVGIELRRALRAVLGNCGGFPGGLVARWRSSRGSGGRGVVPLAALGRSQSGTGCPAWLGVLPRSVCSPPNFARPSLNATAPVPSRRTKAGRVVMPYNDMRASPPGPAAST